MNLVFGDKEYVDYEDAREMAITGVQQVFPESGCSRACLRQQLDKFYKKLCNPDKLKTHSGSNQGSGNRRQEEAIKAAVKKKEANAAASF